MWWWAVPVRKRVAVANFRHALPDQPPGPALRTMMCGLLLGYFELFRELRRPGSIQVDYRDTQPLLDHLATSGKGALLLAGHYGSWDLLGPMTNRDLRLPASTVVKMPRQVAVAALIEKIRLQMTMELLPARDVMPEIYRQLETGRVIVMLLDQRMNRGIAVPFFGRPAWTSPALAVAAQKTQLPVFPLHYYRVGTGRHVVEIGPPIPLTGEVVDDTATLQSIYADYIRQRPHNWLWMHDRWRQPAA